MCNKVADSGDVVIGRRGLSTVDTRVSTIATTPPPFSDPGRSSETRSKTEIELVRAHRNQILLRGRHLGARRLLPLQHMNQLT
jgi:hypothetical protein